MAAKKIGFYHYQEVIPGIFVISSANVKMFLLVGKENALLVDTGYGFEDPHIVTENITHVPLKVLNSHGHIDHAGGNHFFQSEPIFMHSADWDVAKIHSSEPIRRPIIKTLKTFQRLFFWVPLIPKNLDEDQYVKSINHPETYHPLKEGDSFDLGGMTAQVFELPGHTGGSIGVLIPERRLIITSDAANPGTWLFLDESQPLAVYQASLRKLRSLDFDLILTGHSSHLYTKADFANWIGVSENPDWDNGRRQKKSTFSNSADVRICREKNNKRNPARIWISQEKR